MVPSQAIDGGAPGPGHTGTTCRAKEVTFICKCFASLLGCQGIYFEEKNTKYIISKNFFFFFAGWGEQAQMFHKTGKLRCQEEISVV